MSEKPWKGRFSQQTDKMVEAFTASIDLDRRLFAHDIAGSRAHARMLARQGIVTVREAAEMESGLESVKREIKNGRFVFDDALEDIHMHVESRLIELKGEAGRKLHTARSRNDQVALDVRMYLRDACLDLLDGLVAMRGAFLDLAKTHADVVMPGYTHVQRAQPVLFSHHLMAYFEMFSRDFDRLKDAMARINVMPLGSAAMAGTSFPIDPEYVARLLGFPRVTANSMDAVSDRDFLIEFLAAAAMAMMHFSRLSEEMVLWSSSEFSFIELPDAFTTGSSIMPQKKNPDVSELVRGKTGKVYGNLMAMLTLMKGLPLTYNRDLQEDKAAMFQAVDTLTACIQIHVRMLPRITVRDDVMKAAALRGYLNATDLADYLVGKNVAFRKAHEIVGQAVRFGIEAKKELHELSLDDLQRFCDKIDADVFNALGLDHMIARRSHLGGTGREPVASAMKEGRERLEKDRVWVDEFMENLNKSEITP